MVLGTAEFLSDLTEPVQADVFEVAAKELEAIGEFKTNETALAVARMKANQPIEIHLDEYALVLDDIRDPGNLGTIIRTADWYGINKIIASAETADFYSSK